MNIKKNCTEYTINSLTVLAEKSTSTDGSQKSQQKFDAKCLFSLRTDAEGNPISLVVKQENLPSLMKEMAQHIVHGESHD